DVKEVGESGVEEVRAVDEREVDADPLVDESGERRLRARVDEPDPLVKTGAAKVREANPLVVVRLGGIDRDVPPSVARRVRARDRERREAVRHPGLERLVEMLVADERGKTDGVIPGDANGHGGAPLAAVRLDLAA